MIESDNDIVPIFYSCIRRSTRKNKKGYILITYLKLLTFDQLKDNNERKSILLKSYYISFIEFFLNESKISTII